MKQSLLLLLLLSLVYAAVAAAMPSNEDDRDVTLSVEDEKVKSVIDEVDTPLHRMLRSDGMDDMDDAEEENHEEDYDDEDDGNVERLLKKNVFDERTRRSKSPNKKRNKLGQCEINLHDTRKELDNAKMEVDHIQEKLDEAQVHLSDARAELAACHNEKEPQEPEGDGDGGGPTLGSGSYQTCQSDSTCDTILGTSYLCANSVCKLKDGHACTGQAECSSNLCSSVNGSIGKCLACGPNTCGDDYPVGSVCCQNKESGSLSAVMCKQGVNIVCEPYENSGYYY